MASRWLTRSRRSHRDSVPQSLSPLHDGDEEEDGSTSSFSKASSTSSSSSDTIFESMNSDSIPGNLHITSNESINHLMQRYGGTVLIKQLSADLAQREAELNMVRRKNSLREKILFRLLSDAGYTTSQVELIIKQELDKPQLNSKEHSNENYLANLINDAMSEPAIPKDSSTFLPKSESTPKRANLQRSYSLSSPVNPPQSSSGLTDQDANTSNYLFNVVNSHTFLNHVPQPVHDVIISNNNLQKLVPVEMEDFDPENTKPPTYSSSHNETAQGYIDKYGFLYDQSSKIQGGSKLNSPKDIFDNSAITSKLLEIANDYDRDQKQNNKQWDEFIKKITILNNDNTEGLLIINGKDISNYKHIYKEFTKLVQQGIPMKYRTKVWFELSGAKNLMTPSEYEFLLQNAQANPEAESQVELDLYRTMPLNVFFKDNGPGLTKLKNLLIAFSRKHKEIGYCQGMNFIAAILLLVYPVEEDAFWVLNGIVEDILPKNFFNLLNIKNDMNVFKSCFIEMLPKLNEHFSRIDVELEPICFNWFVSLFTDSLPIDIVFKIWDNMMLSGYDVIFKISIALFKVFEKTLLDMSTNVKVYEFMKNLNRVNFNLKSTDLIRLSTGVIIHR